MNGYHCNLYIARANDRLIAALYKKEPRQLVISGFQYWCKTPVDKATHLYYEAPQITDVPQ
jgi:hypothetical protein